MNSLTSTSGTIYGYGVVVDEVEDDVEDVELEVLVEVDVDVLDEVEEDVEEVLDEVEVEEDVEELVEVDDDVELEVEVELDVDEDVVEDVVEEDVDVEVDVEELVDEDVEVEVDEVVGSVNGSNAPIRTHSVCGSLPVPKVIEFSPAARAALLSPIEPEVSFRSIPPAVIEVATAKFDAQYVIQQFSVLVVRLVVRGVDPVSVVAASGTPV